MPGMDDDDEQRDGEKNWVMRLVIVINAWVEAAHLLLSQDGRDDHGVFTMVLCGQGG